MLRIKFMDTSCEIAINSMPQNTRDVNTGLGNGLLPKGNNPLPEPMLTQIYVAIWSH